MANRLTIIQIKHEELKKCLKCGKWKPFSAFAKDKSRKTGRQNFCRECQKEYRLNRKHISSKLFRWRKYSKRFYLTQDNQQGWVCQACGQTQAKELPSYIIPFGHDYLKLCSKCKNILLVKKIKEFYELIKIVRKRS